MYSIHCLLFVSQQSCYCYKIVKQPETLRRAKKFVLIVGFLLYTLLISLNSQTVVWCTMKVLRNYNYLLLFSFTFFLKNLVAKVISWEYDSCIVDKLEKYPCRLPFLTWLNQDQAAQFTGNQGQPRPCGGLPIIPQVVTHAGRLWPGLGTVCSSVTLSSWSVWWD